MSSAAVAGHTWLINSVTRGHSDGSYPTAVRTCIGTSAGLRWHAASTPTAAKPQRLSRALHCCASASPSIETATKSTFRPAKPTLFDMPVSNNGARVRFVIYKKGLDVDIRPPSDLGGLKSPEYLSLNPQGKMPLLVLPTGMAIPESEVIVQYLVSKCRSTGPSLIAATPETQAIGNLATRLMDTYINSIQQCLYKEMDIAQRADQIRQIAMQLDVLDSIIIGPFVCGDDPTTADGCLLGTIAWLEYILPNKFGWSSVFQGRPKLERWWEAVSTDPAGKKVIDELQGALNGWDEGGRWKKLGIEDQVKNTTYKWSY